MTLGKISVVIFLCNILQSSQDFLEYYQPRSGFPKELNDWLAYVQGHRNDFRIIRNIVKRKKEEVDYYDERESEVKLLNDLDGVEEEMPQNDIFPHDLDKQKGSKKRSDNPSRTRRHSFFEQRNNVEIDPRSKNGEIKRSEDKYPDQFVNRAKEDLIKREIEIDILNDGKLVKSIKENEKEPKSIVLNIQNGEDQRKSLVDMQPKLLEPPIVHINSPQRSIEIDNNGNKEMASNYQNLFSSNENLNTDSSVAREALAKTALMYHVTLPDPNFIIQHDNPNTTYNSFQRNNLNDMSKYWSVSEKNQLQQGLEFAQETGSLRKMQQGIPQKSNDGFESARTVIVEHVANKPNNDELQQSPHRAQNKRNLQSLDGRVQLGSPIYSTSNMQDNPYDHLEYTVRNKLADARQVSLPLSDYNIPQPSSNIKTNNHIIFVTKGNPTYGNSDNPPEIKRVDENINNHIAITIVEPQKDEEPKEEVKDELPIENFEPVTIPNREECSNQNCEMKISEDSKSILEDSRPEIIQENASPQLNKERNVFVKNNQNNNGTYDNTNEKLCENGQCFDRSTPRNQKNDIKIHIEPQPHEGNDKVDDINNSPKLVNKLDKEDLCQGPNCNNAELPCEGPNCGQYRFSRNKHKRKRGKRRHKHRIYNEYFPSYKLRQLQASNYVNEESVEDYVISSERTKRLEFNKKESVEGDYGDEEDSEALKGNVSTKLIKKSENIFANPHTTLEPDDDDDYYYDDAIEKVKNFNNKSENDNTKIDSTDDNASIGKRIHKKNKASPKQPQLKGVTKMESQVREPRASDENFQQLPQFVIDDQLNEENLKKRSLANQKDVHKNKFPLSSKSFFAGNNPKRRDSNNEEILVDKPSSSPALELGSTVSDSLGAGDLLDPKESSTAGNSNDVSSISENSTISAITDECENTHISIEPVCATDNFTKVRVTTMLNLVGESQTDLNGSLPSLNEQYQNLEDILIGRLPLSIVDSVFKHMTMHPTFKQRFFKGMKKNHAPVSFRNLPEISSKESNKLIRLMSKIMNRLQWTTTCQVLPNKLKRYLKAITQVKIEDRLTKTKAMEEVDFDDSQNQTSFIFHSNNGADNIEEKVKILKNMLNKYEHLPDSCKPRAEPVKEYIENHLDMLTHVMSNNIEVPRPRKSDTIEAPQETVSESVHHEAAKRNEKNEDTDLIEQELESLGLGKHPNFRPKFDIEAFLHKSNQSKDQGLQEARKLTTYKKTNKRDISRETSNEYDRLLEAVKKERIKREGRKRIADAFGKLSIEDYNGKNSDNSVKEIFENPLVYSF